MDGAAFDADPAAGAFHIGDQNPARIRICAFFMCDGIFRAGQHTAAAVEALFFVPQDLLPAALAFRVGTPFTTKRAAFKKYQRANSWAGVHIIFLSVEYECFTFNHVLSISRLLFLRLNYKLTEGKEHIRDEFCIPSV